MKQKCCERTEVVLLYFPTHTQQVRERTVLCVTKHCYTELLALRSVIRFVYADWEYAVLARLDDYSSSLTERLRPSRGVTNAAKEEQRIGSGDTRVELFYSYTLQPHPARCSILEKHGLARLFASISSNRAAYIRL